MRQVLLDIHIYLGLLCAGYMIIYGVSALCFNHNVKPTESEGAAWEVTIEVPEADSDQGLADAVRDRLDLIDWVPFWRHSYPQPHEYVFYVDRPAREYRIHLDLATGVVRVRETDRGVLGAVLGLHAPKNLPNSRWGVTWTVYTEASIWAIVFSVGCGIWFWWLRPTYRRLGWWLLGLGSGGTALLMICIVA